MECFCFKVSKEKLQQCCDDPLLAEGQGQSCFKKVWLSFALSLISLSSFWHITWNHTSHSTQFMFSLRRIVKVKWKFWKAVCGCWNQLQSCALQWLTVVSVFGNTLASQLANAHSCVNYQRIRRLWVGCRGWWGSKTEKQPPTQQRRSSRSHKACEKREIQLLSYKIIRRCLFVCFF